MPHQLNHNLIKLMKEWASKLPKISVLSHETHLLKGAEILAWGTITHIKDQPIDPDKEYKWKYPVMQYANHYRRIKKAYLKNGVTGMESYQQQVDALVKQKQVKGAIKVVQKIVQTVNR